MSNEAAIADLIIERERQRKRSRFWLLLSLISLVLLFLNITSDADFRDFDMPSIPKRAHIAHLELTGQIFTDQYRSRVLQELAESNSVKAVLLSINSPGGAATAGEDLYQQIKRLQDKVPVVVAMGDMATSAAYMAALPAEKIFARRSTITASVGVLFQMPYIEELMKKIGVGAHIVTTGQLKAQPSPIDAMTAQEKQLVTGIITEFQGFFLDKVQSHRKVSKEVLEQVSDGRIVGGKRAKEMGLVDAIGGEYEALHWLRENKDITDKIPLIEISLIEPESSIDKLLNTSTKIGAFFQSKSLQGLLSVSNTGAIQ